MGKPRQTLSKTVQPLRAYGLASTHTVRSQTLFKPALAQPRAASEHISITSQVCDDCKTARLGKGVIYRFDIYVRNIKSSRETVFFEI